MSAKPAPAPAEPANRLGQLLLGLLIALAAFTVPRVPALELDASWRMIMGYGIYNHLQWGTDLVFTYGPLGFMMAKTYWGHLFWEMIGWQAFQAALAGWLFVSAGRRLGPVGRFFFFLFAVLFGVVYEDALEMIVIALLGWKLLRQVDEEKPNTGWIFAVLLAIYGAVKFTNLLLAGFAVVVAVGLALHRRSHRNAALLAGAFAGGTVAVWLLCGQNPLNFFAYLRASLEVSSGYNDAMSVPSPAAPFKSAMIVVGLLVGYLGLHLRTSTRRPFAIANVLLACAFLFLNWKHGFVRSDGHMIGFFICALVPITAFPALFDDARPGRWIRQALLVPAGILCVVGIEQALPSMVRGITSQLQDRLWSRAYELTHWHEFRQGLRDKMTELRIANDLHFVREKVGDATLDVFGYEQAIIVFNKFNYHPRPVFQSYTAYNEPLARRNLEFYNSEDAPQYVLLKIQSIDSRLPTMDDPLLLNYFLHAYDYVLTEKDWQLWKRRADAPPAERVAPRRLSTTELRFGESLELGDLTSSPTWIQIDVRPSLFGRFRDFLYKQPPLLLVVEDTAGQTTRYRLPSGEGRAGFILNPLIESTADYMHFAGGKPPRRVARLRIETDGNRYFFRSKIEVGLFSLTPSDAGARYFNEIERAWFGVFKTVPVANHAFVPLGGTTIDGVPSLVAHAPSQLEFEIPAGATTIAGRFGYSPGAYVGDARTNGADFRVVWSDGTAEHVLFSQYLDPLNQPADRGLHSFSCPLTGITSGRVFLVADPGPGGDNGWDWTAWTGIEIR